MATRGWNNAVADQLAHRRQKAPGVPVARRSASKYKAVRTMVNGWTFDSKREAARYQELLAQGAAGWIRDLELQPSFPIIVLGVHIGVYRADFRYQAKSLDTLIGSGAWRDVVEDVKGVRTPVFILKKKLVEALYGITITEVR